MTALTNASGLTVDVPAEVVDDYLKQGWREPNTDPAEPDEPKPPHSRKKTADK